MGARLEVCELSCGASGLHQNGGFEHEETDVSVCVSNEGSKKEGGYIEVASAVTILEGRYAQLARQFGELDASTSSQSSKIHQIELAFADLRSKVSDIDVAVAHASDNESHWRTAQRDGTEREGAILTEPYVHVEPNPASAKDTTQVFSASAESPSSTQRARRPN